jgi:hypothetical protein
MQERRRGIGPAAAVGVDLKQQFRLRINRRVQPFFLTIDLDLFFIDGDP